jgi:hypothetical protein
MKRSPLFIASIVVASLLSTISLTACEVTTASLSEATMCRSVDSDMRPVDAADIFATDTPEIFCSVKLSSAPSDTEVKAEWIYVQGELEGTENYLIDDYTLTAEGTLYLGFSLTEPDAGWPTGEYKVILYVDGEEKLSVPFTVQ